VRIGQPSLGGCCPGGPGHAAGFGSLLEGIGQCLLSRQRALGHSTTRLTLDTYSHVTTGMQEQVARRLDTMFGETDAPGASGG
jgi:hypothetical protein